MPGFDGMGPLGDGPLTGGGRGYCISPVSKRRASLPFFNRRPGYLFLNLFRLCLGLRGRGRGGGRRRRYWW
ncbi:MAG: DUF5320 domain-containing protein [Firmicutes bacterium]|jgi:hypothetical protein|nr:DUF5320 domain-containing protein [Bacillota bacterium]NLL58324.1 DUF5320 domain-containing protein [Bacillota bacterium]